MPDFVNLPMESKQEILRQTMENENILQSNLASLQEFKEKSTQEFMRLQYQVNNDMSERETKF
jgi:hypothetical protein